MYRSAALPLYLLCASCSGAAVVDQLEHTKWGNAAQPCSVNYLTFNGGQILAHPFGGELPLWKIRKIDAGGSSSKVDVEVEPAESVLKNVRGRALKLPDNPVLTLHLRIEGDKMRIDATSFRGVRKSVRSGSTLTMFNAFACPA
jgi:hypothetical protein